MTLATSIARFTTSLDVGSIPAEVSEKARTCLLNAYGMALDGHATPYAKVARRVAIAMDGEVVGGATLLGDGRTTTVGGAGLANAALFHGRAQEDTCGAAHFGTILIPLLTAMLEARHFPTTRLLPALVAGYEAGGLLEKAFAGHTTPAGFRSSALYGVIAAAAAAARMMELTVAQTAAALSNAVSLTGGVLQSFADGTDEWRYQVGHAGRTGLLAAELARCGSVSAPLAFEGKSGLARTFARQTCDVEDLAGRLGRDWAMFRVAFKPYPVCAFNQTPVTAALAMREELAGAEFAEVRVRMNPYETSYAGMDAAGPFGTISGTLMSIPFCIATTLLYGVPDMARMTTYDDPAVTALIGRIRLVPDAGVPVLSSIIEAETTDRRRVVREQPMTAADYSYDRATVSSLVRRIGREEGVPAAAFDAVDDFVARLPDAPVSEVIAAFRLLPRQPM